jgi:uncharacterized protein YyaL (SSP411 family)
MNHLSQEKSPYLRHAAHQMIDWYAWSDEAFEKAKQENKPVFLSTGAVWCHWCHVMAKESFEDEETARLLNDLFVCIKLDRDERPDIDRRYQQAVAAMGSGSGWPLTVFLTPDREPFFGGTYFPPEDWQGRPGLKNVLRAVSNFYRTKREDAAAYAQQVMDTLKPELFPPGDLAESFLTDAENSMLALFDQEHGGFGAAPKFPMPGALEFLIRRSVRGVNSPAGNAAKRTIEAMAQGGFHDQLGGGFHRYSVDESWIVPHFEKMADDNAGLLKNCIDGYAVFGDEQFRDTARDIIAFTRDVLSDPRGGFYASQDADVTPDDEGGYFTWTEEEFKRVLDPEEYALLSLLLLDARGSMHHDPARKVLSVVRPPQELAVKLGKNADDVQAMIMRGKKKLLAARTRRQTPFIDKTLYTSLNGMLIAAYFHAFAVLGDEEVRAFGLKSLERVLQERFADGNLLHSESAPALLDDYVHLIDALLRAYEAAAEQRYLVLADTLMQTCLGKFFDQEAGGFFDTEQEVLGTRLKRVEDIPHPSANAVAIMVLLKLALMTGKEEYRRRAEMTLRAFVDQAREMNVHAGAYFCALDAYFNMITLTVEASPATGLARTARSLSGKIYTAIIYGTDRSRVIPCRNTVCYEPISDPARLQSFCTSLS